MNVKKKSLNRDPEKGSIKDFESCLAVTPYDDLKDGLQNFKKQLASYSIDEIYVKYPSKGHLIMGFMDAFGAFDIQLFPIVILPDGLKYPYYSNISSNIEFLKLKYD